jgi:hypothetical protein
MIAATITLAVRDVVIRLPLPCGEKMKVGMPVNFKGRRSTPILAFRRRGERLDFSMMSDRDTWRGVTVTRNTGKSVFLDA